MDDLPSTREVLGEHLYQMIREVLNQHDGGNSMVDKITGILLERPFEDIYKMLEDVNVLKRNVEIAAGCVRESNVKEETLKDCHDLSEEEVNQQLYERVCQLNRHHASKITGMLLELDKATRVDLLHDPTKFLHAFEKAQTCLLGYEKAPTSLREDVEDEKDDWSHVIYEHAEQMYKDFAPRITGMILELDSRTLGRIVSDKNSLEAALVKAYNALTDNMCL